MDPASSASALPARSNAVPGLPAMRRWAPGLALCAAIALATTALSQLPWLQSNGVSALTLSILFGILLGNTVYPRVQAVADPGVQLAKQRLLRLGVVLYGLRLTVQDIGVVGAAGLAVDALVIVSTFGIACLLGIRWLGMDRETAMLIGAGSSICGAAAVMATQPVVRARADQVSVAVATVVVFGTLCIFLYPLLFELNQRWAFIPGGMAGFGIYAGSTIHEVAQVVAAARSISPEVADTAVITKMVRVMMLAPFLIALAMALVWLGSREAGAAAPQVPGWRQLPIPWFALGFVAVVLFNSLQWLSPRAVDVLLLVDAVLLAMAMAALGLSTHLGAIRRAGLRPLLLALVLFVWLVAGGAWLNHIVPRWLS